MADEGDDRSRPSLWVEWGHEACSRRRLSLCACLPTTFPLTEWSLQPVSVRQTC